MTEDLEQLTPHVDRRWREEFVVELRLAGTPGDQIGDALVTVDAHCAESGEPVGDAFGDPVAYARELLGEGASRARLRPRLVVGLAFGLLAMLMLPRAVEDWRRGDQFDVTAGDLVVTGLLVLLAGLLLRRPEPLLGWLHRHPATAFSLPFGVLVAMVVPAALLRDTVMSLDWRVAALVGLVASVLSVVLPWPDLSRPDPITDPREPRSGGARRDPFVWVTVFMFPVLITIMIGYDALLRALV